MNPLPLEHETNYIFITTAKLKSSQSTESFLRALLLYGNKSDFEKYIVLAHLIASSFRLGKQTSA